MQGLYQDQKFLDLVIFSTKIEFSNNPQCCIIRCHINDAMTLSHARPVGDGYDPASDNLRMRREGKAKPAIQDPVDEASKIFPVCFARNPRNYYIHLLIILGSA